MQRCCIHCQVTITASVLCMMFVAINRYYAIVHPLRRHLRFRKPKLTGPFIWIGSLVSMSVFLLIYWRTTIIRLFISWVIQMGVLEGYTSSCSSSTISSPWPLFLFCILHFMEFMVPCCTWSEYFERKSSATGNLQEKSGSDAHYCYLCLCPLLAPTTSGPHDDHHSRIKDLPTYTADCQLCVFLVWTRQQCR